MEGLVSYSPLPGGPRDSLLTSKGRTQRLEGVGKLATVCIPRELQLQDPVISQLALVNFVTLGKLLSL